MYCNMRLNNHNFGDFTNLHNMYSSNMNNQMSLNPSFNRYVSPYNNFAVPLIDNACYMIDSCSLFNEHIPTPIKICKDVKSFGSCSEQQTTPSQNQFAFNNYKLESYAMNNFCLCNNFSQDTKFDTQNQRYLVENYGDFCEENKEANCEYNNVGLTKFKSMATDVDKFINYETINDEVSNPLISKTVEEVLHSQTLNDVIRSGLSFGRSKRKLYHLRQDVIIKIIFRCMRKYYLKDFKAFFDFSKCSSASNSDTNGVLYRQINRYLDTKFGDSTLENMAIYFISIIDIKEKFISISDEHRELKETISGLLYCYNKPKLLNLIKIPQFALLMFSFLNKSNILKLVIKSQDSSEVIQTYSEIIQTLKCQCSMSLRT